MGRVLLLSLMAASLVACGKASGEEIAMAQGMYADLVEQHNEVAEAYASVEDDSLGKELDEMAEKVESICSSGYPKKQYMCGSVRSLFVRSIKYGQRGKPDKGYGVSGWIGDIEYSEYFCNRRGGTLASGSNG